MTNHSIMQPNNIQNAAIKLQTLLPDLLGDSWEIIGVEFSSRLDDLVEANSDSERYAASIVLVGVVSEFKKAREKFRELILREDEVGGALMQMGDMVSKTEPISGTKLRDAAEPAELERFIQLHDPDKAKSIKLGNIEFDFAEAYLVMAAVTTAVIDYLFDNDASPLVISAGILVVVQRIVDGAIVEFDEREATVLWGISEAASAKERVAEESGILMKTNAARQQIGLSSLGVQDLRNALHKLHQAKTIKKLDETTWKIVEKIRVNPK